MKIKAPFLLLPPVHGFTKGKGEPMTALSVIRKWTPLFFLLSLFIFAYLLSKLSWTLLYLQ